MKKPPHPNATPNITTNSSFSLTYKTPNNEIVKSDTAPIKNKDTQTLLTFFKSLKSFQIDSDQTQLIPVTSADNDFIIKARNQKEQHYLGTGHLSEQGHQTFIDAYMKTDNDLYFIAKSKQKNVPIGTIALHNINPRHKNAEIGRFFILPAYRLLALDVCRLLHIFAFEILELKTLIGFQVADNTAAKSYIQYGYQHDGCFRQCHLNNGTLKDINIFSLTEKEYYILKKKYHTFFTAKK